MQASFFMTFVLSSGWASLACEVMQPLALICKLVKKFILRIKDDSPDTVWSFPYHTEIPRVLLFGFLGFICSILVPLITPFLLFYFGLAYLVYRNQVMTSFLILFYILIKWFKNSHLLYFYFPFYIKCIGHSRLLL